MGSWFSNLHIRKNDGITKESVCNCIKNTFSERNCTQVECAEDADFTVTVYIPRNSDWISICSDELSHDDPDSCKDIIAPLSAQLHTDVMGIACFDSDFLYLNLINADENVNAWIGIGEGKEMGITRRNNVTAWKKKVVDYPAFSAAVKDQYVCADDFLEITDRFLGLSMEQGGISPKYLEDIPLQGDALHLYFCQAEDRHSAGPNIQICNMRFAVPCFDGNENFVSFLNFGDEFCGLSVYFLGSFVEHEEITFSDIRLEQFQGPFRTLELKKIQLSDGQWAYHCHIPDLLMPPGIQGRMKPEKRYQLERERIRTISFVPHGNPRKMLDITVVLIPDGNPDNQAQWNIWHQHGSKEAFIKWHNKMWKMIGAIETDPNQVLPLLKLEDFVE